MQPDGFARPFAHAGSFLPGYRRIQIVGPNRNALVEGITWTRRILNALSMRPTGWGRPIANSHQLDLDLRVRTEGFHVYNQAGAFED